MRQIGSFNEEIKAVEFSQLLQSNNITCLIDEDNGSFCIWVHEEGQIKRARKMFDDFNEGKISYFKKSNPPPPGVSKESNSGSKQPPQTFVYQPYITKALLILCVLVYIIAMIQTYSKGRLDVGGGFYPPIAKDLFMDYPRSLEIHEELIDKYGQEAIKKNQLPEEAEPLVKEFSENPPWIGVYNIMMVPKENRQALWHGQFLQKVRHGQVWRLFTPVVLHLTLLHFLFNMLWLIILGKMVEFNMGRIKFVLFILITGIFSNFCQYIMTGPFFLGISGVLSGFIGYIWVRKKIAPWEVYFIKKETLYFFLTFIFGFLVVQIVSFLLQYFQVFSFPVPIANTGHISGLIMGMFLAKTNLMSRKSV
ncbi:MAG: Rhomboid protease GlpG [Chlamydiia bacterium]|nr:Rhomboid protease GlpG [Chlamydiia bacterium]